MTEIYLLVKSGVMYGVSHENVEASMKFNKRSKLEVLARCIDSEHPPVITYTDLANGYTVLSDDEGLFTSEHLYIITDIDGTTYNIPGTCIFAKLDEKKNTLPLNNDDIEYLQANVPLKCSKMPEVQ